MAKGMLARYKAMNGKKNSQIAVLRSAYKNYSPSVTNTLTVGAGGFVAGTVMSGRYLPSEIAGISTPLVIGGLLASYGIFSGKDDKPSNDMVSKLAVNLGNGMISAWAASYAMDMFEGQDMQQSPVNGQSRPMA